MVSSLVLQEAGKFSVSWLWGQFSPRGNTISHLKSGTVQSGQGTQLGLNSALKSPTSLSSGLSFPPLASQPLIWDNPPGYWSTDVMERGRLRPAVALEVLDTSGRISSA